MALSDDGADRAWYLAEMQRRLEHFDVVRVQINALKLFYFKKQSDYFDEICELDRDDPRQNAKRKSLFRKMDNALAAFKAIRTL